MGGNPSTADPGGLVFIIRKHLGNNGLKLPVGVVGVVHLQQEEGSLGFVTINDLAADRRFNRRTHGLNTAGLQSEKTRRRLRVGILYYVQNK